MFWKITKFFMIAVCLSVLAASARADTLPVGLFSFDDLAPGDSGPTFALDITNLSGPLGLGFVSSTVSFENLSLTVTYTGGASSPSGPLTPDGFGDFSTGTAFVGGDVESALLTGTFSPLTVTLPDGSTVAIAGSFSATITDPSGPLVDTDSALINVVTSPIVSGVPEPGTGLLLLFGFALAGAWALGRRAA